MIFLVMKETTIECPYSRQNFDQYKFNYNLNWVSKSMIPNWRQVLISKGKSP